MPIDDSVTKDEQGTIDLYFRWGLIKWKLVAADSVDRSFSDAFAKGAGLRAHRRSRWPFCWLSVRIESSPSHVNLRLKRHSVTLAHRYVLHMTSAV
ncbi:hypothetical protein [Bradyrhizobium ganzhouense]|uniref:hypothetical protein n=1 Tax=Bradyrhizobium ganzhouense TaxID=1179767 RepID=UPI003CF66CBF